MAPPASCEESVALGGPRQRAEGGPPGSPAAQQQQAASSLQGGPSAAAAEGSGPPQSEAQDPPKGPQAAAAAASEDGPRHSAAEGRGCLLLKWLLLHFPCRLFLDARRSRAVNPGRLIRLHPSPAVELMRRQQQQLLALQQQFLQQDEQQRHSPLKPQHSLAAGESRGPQLEQQQQQQQQQQRQQQQQKQETCPLLHRRLRCLAARLAGLDSATPDAERPSEAAPRSSRSSKSSSSSNSSKSSSSSSSSCVCEALHGFEGVAWTGSSRAGLSVAGGACAAGSCPIDAFSCGFAFAVDADGVCSISPLAAQQREQQQQQRQQQDRQRQQQDELQAKQEADGELQAGCQPASEGPLPLEVERALADLPTGAPLGGSPWADVSVASLQELLFFLWGPPDACMAADAAACDFAQWRLTADLCGSCSSKRSEVYRQTLPCPTAPSSSSSSSSIDRDISSSSSNRNKEEASSLFAFSSACTCCCLRCCCIRMPAWVLEAVARDGLRLPRLSGSSSSSSSSSSSKKGTLPERLLRNRGVCLQHGFVDASSDSSSSWLSELPSSASSASSPPDSPRTPPPPAPSAAEQPPPPPAAAAVAAEVLSAAKAGVGGEKRAAGDESLPGLQRQEEKMRPSAAAAALSAASAEAAVAALQACLSVCLPRAGGRVTPVLSGFTLEDAAWMVSAAHNVSASAGGSQLASARSFLAFACTEPWEVLLLLHASAATTQALGGTLSGCADVSPGGPSTTPRRVAVRPLASRPGVYRQLHTTQQQQQQQRQGGFLSLPVWLTLFSSCVLQKGREFRVFVAGAKPIGISQRWLGECCSELGRSSSARKKIRRAVWGFASSTLSRLALPPLFAADLYVHRNADGSDTCRLLMLHPWGSLTDPLLFSYEELRGLALAGACVDGEEACTVCSGEPPRKAGGAPSAAASCCCWERCPLRFLKGSDEEVHDAQRSLAMPRDLLEIARGGVASADVENLLLDLNCSGPRLSRLTKGFFAVSQQQAGGEMQRKGEQKKMQEEETEEKRRKNRRLPD
ncbi:hypothetical protein Efla_005446 [Eimeria flavescens]